ncbi:MAG: hypothetical protein NXI04_22825 [Planctomycetaceae bacterium]|nr:hypothetical protein [Planctomycetaceae bacterium]
MAKKKATAKTKKKVAKASPKTARKKTPAKKTAVKKSPVKKAAKKKVAVKKATPKKAAVKKTAVKKTTTKKAAVKKKAPVKQPRKKGVRRATLSSGIRKKSDRRLGRSRVPADAPLAVVFQNDAEAQKAFAFLEIQTIRELEEFDPDELVRRLSSPAKQTVGRIRKILALNNRCLQSDESFAVEFQEIAQNQMKIKIR